MILQSELAANQSNRGPGLALALEAFSDNNLVATVVDRVDRVIHDVFAAALGLIPAAPGEFFEFVAVHVAAFNRNAENSPCGFDAVAVA